MTKLSRLAWVCVVLVVLGSAAYCQNVFPAVDFAFDSETFEYSWTVNYTTDVNVNFTTMQVYTRILPLSWTSVSGAWSGDPAVDEGWNFTYPANGDGTVALRWKGEEKQRLAGSGPWTGVFKITVPNSRPVDGQLRMWSSVTTAETQSTFVPEVIPEPSSLLALGSMAGIVPFVLRKKKK